jgi:cysteine desulfurase / selenocysteine lyase
MFDPQHFRSDFPILEQQVNGHPLIYLDNGASTQKPRCVIDALTNYYQHDHSNVHRGLHELSNRATAAFEKARLTLAQYFNARSEKEIIFTRGTTESINLVAQSWGRQNLKQGDIILLTEMEHHSNIVPWQLVAQATGASIRYLPVTEKGAALDLSRLEEFLTPQVKLFALTHISNTLGVINPIIELCQKARKLGIVTLVDAAQSAGHDLVDVQAIGCDFLACSSHKMAGPTGMGVLYGRLELLDSMPPWQGGGEMISRVTYEGSEWKPAPARFEAGTPNIADAIALAVAVRYLDQIGREKIAAHDHSLAQLAYEKLQALGFLNILGPSPAQSQRAGLLTFTMEGVHAHDITEMANQHGVALRGGHHCNQPLMRKLGAPSSTRASFYLYNTEQEIDVLVQTLKKIHHFFNR